MKAKMLRGFFAESAYNNNTSNYGKQKSSQKDVFSETKQKLYDDVLCKLNERHSENYEPDWEQRRFDAAMNFMGNMLNADETWRTKLVSDLLYKEVAAFSVKCADALIEELKKER